MSAANWLVPLNVHHSMKLRSLSSSSNANSQHLQNISSSLSALTYQINTIEKNSIELTGTANSILQLLESNKYKESTIGAMRLLLFNHAKTCKEAINEDDNVLAYSICLISEGIINQPWFNFDLFSLVSFDEMEKAEEIKGTCQNIMKEIQDNMSLEEWNMIKVFQESINAVESARKICNRLEDSFVKMIAVEGMGWCDKFVVNATESDIRVNYCNQYQRTLGDTPVIIFSISRNMSASEVMEFNYHSKEIIRSVLPFLTVPEPKSYWWGNKPWVGILPNCAGDAGESWHSRILETHENYMSAYDNLRNIERSIIEPANVLFDGRIRIEVEEIAQ